jgi:hypothetical protein
MGLLLRIKYFYFQWIRAACSRPTKGAAVLVFARIKRFLSIHQAGNKSGALLLTKFGLTHRHGNDLFTP